MDAALEILESGSRSDAWADLSTDVIARFIDVMEVEYGLSRIARRGYRRELAALDEWMLRTRGRALATAGRGDLWAYLRTRLPAGARTREFERLLMCLQHFYRHLKESGYRSDNAAAQLCAILAGDAMEAAAQTPMRRAG